MARHRPQRGERMTGSVKNNDMMVTGNGQGRGGCGNGGYRPSFWGDGFPGENSVLWESETCEKLGQGSRQSEEQLQSPWCGRDFVSTRATKRASEAGSKSAGGGSKDVLEIQPWAGFSKGFKSGKGFGFHSVWGSVWDSLNLSSLSTGDIPWPNFTAYVALRCGHMNEN